jgi:hypothetical protein
VRNIETAKCSICTFLKAAQGNWRNAIYIGCSGCAQKESPCTGFLMSADRDAKPILVELTQFQRLTGERVYQDDCAGILSRQAFESAYAQWLLWEISEPGECSLTQLLAGSG